MLAQTGRLPEAETALREAIRVDPAYAHAHNGLGLLLRDAKRYPEAEAAFREAIRLDPALAVAHANLGVMLRRPVGSRRPRPPSGRRSASTPPTPTRITASAW